MAASCSTREIELSVSILSETEQVISKAGKTANLIFHLLPKQNAQNSSPSSFFFPTGLEPHIWNFLFYTLNIFLTSLAGTAVALVFSASVAVHTIGTILTALIWVFMMVFSGLLVNVDTVAVWLQWMKWFSIFRYSMNVSAILKKT